MTPEETEAKCRRLESILANIKRAWREVNDLPDGYARLAFTIKTIDSEEIRYE